MVFFFLVPIAPAVLGNFLIPLMIGVRDVSFSRLNLASWYLFLIGGCVELYMMISGGVDTGWTFTTPLTGSGKTKSSYPPWESSLPASPPS